MNNTNPLGLGVALLVLAATSLAAVVADPAALAAKTGQDRAMSETDMSHSGDADGGGKVTVPWNLLGGAVGDRTVDGVKVELYVLQAVDPSQLKPGDPNHAFTVALKDAKSSEFLKQGTVSIAVTGAGVSGQGSQMALRPNGVFRGGVALPRPGQYKVMIAFKTESRSGQAEFPFVYQPTAPGQHEHQHGGASR